MNRTVRHWMMVVVLMASCGAAGGHRKGEGGPKMTHATWQQELREWNGHPEWEVQITTGTEHFRKGLVTLLLRGDGTAVIRNRRAGQDLPPREGTVPAEQVRELGSRLGALDPSALPGGDRPRVPGDTPVRIEVRRQGTVQAEVRCWHSDRYEVATLDRVLEQADDIVLALTNGELPF
ncbi:MAG TPA: hypothetical protein PLQ97_13305 [Myxococcota bacterium]|nr:hypothetical protein [Myxococcota bacterium]HQK52160.1 hypothetical protein [Myxococcota bacterium]